MLEDVSSKLRVWHRITECQRLVQHEAAAIGAATGDNMVQDGSSPALLETTLE